MFGIPRYDLLLLPLWLSFALRPLPLQQHAGTNQSAKDSAAYALPPDSLLAKCIEAFKNREMSRATAYGIQAATLFHQQKKYASEASAYSYLAEIFKQLGTIDNTIAYSWQGVAYAKKACDLASSIHDTAEWAIALNALGIIYRDIGQFKAYRTYYDSARACYLKALTLIRRSGKATYFIPKLYNNLSQVATEYDHDYPAALQYLSKAIAENEKNHNLVSLSYNFGNVAYVYQLMGNPKLSVAYARKTVAAARALQMPDRLLNAYEQAYESFKTAHQYDSALYYYELYNVIND
ncbi:MAG: hypothetical protein IRZ29_08030, partial [Thermoflavifilum sp.]|nr:hypothetical protein [Thermoflavifilum sp.]